MNHRPLGYEPKGSSSSPVDFIALPRNNSQKTSRSRPILHASCTFAKSSSFGDFALATLPASKSGFHRAGTKAPKSRIRVRGKTPCKISSTQTHSKTCTGNLRLSRIALAKRTRMMRSFAKANWCRKPRKSSTKSLNSPRQLCCRSSFAGQSSAGQSRPTVRYPA